MSFDGPKLLAVAIIVATLVGGWMFRYETMFNGALHRNRFTGALCGISEECWSAAAAN